MQSMSLEPWVPCLVLVLSWPSSVCLEVLILVDPGEEDCSRRHYLSVTALARPHKGKYPCRLKQSHDKLGLFFSLRLTLGEVLSGWNWATGCPPPRSGDTELPSHHPSRA